MTISERDYLLELWEKNICPFCSNSIPDGKRIGSGRRSEGGFCSLDCYAKYYAAELLERASRVADARRKHTVA
jgi:hypothetical protein